MRDVLFIPFFYLCLAVLSLTILQSIAPSLVGYQLLFFLVGGIIFLTTSSISFAQWRKYHWLGYLFAIALLLLTLFIGVVRKGATRWIPLGPFHLQASQIAQPLTLLSLSFYAARVSLRRWQTLSVFFLLSLLPAVLIFIEPNLGTTLVLMTGIGMLFLQTDVKNTVLLSLMSSFFLFVAVAWLFLLQPYQKQRIFSFAFPEKFTESNYNARQSIIAVGSGQWSGRGLGHGVQSQLRFLPERQTDFIFASLAEELGYIGASSLVLLYATFLIYFSWKLFFLKKQLHRFLLAGLIAMFLIQTTINIGMNMGILPITGITLPLVSYGGSSLLSFSFSLGLLQRITVESSKEKVFFIT